MSIQWYPATIANQVDWSIQSMAGAETALADLRYDIPATSSVNEVQLNAAYEQLNGVGKWAAPHDLVHHAALQAARDGNDTLSLALDQAHKPIDRARTQLWNMQFQGTLDGVAQLEVDIADARTRLERIAAAFPEARNTGADPADVIRTGLRGGRAAGAAIVGATALAVGGAVYKIVAD